MTSDGSIAIVNATRGTTLADAARCACGLGRRLIGLMGLAALPTGAGLILAPCTGLHTWFMRFSIDLVYVQLDDVEGRDGVVVRTKTGLRPFRVAPARADLVVELPVGTIARTTTAVGDRIVLRPADRRSSVGR